VYAEESCAVNLPPLFHFKTDSCVPVEWEDVPDTMDLRSFISKAPSTPTTLVLPKTKSMLRYAGGKSRALSLLRQTVPEGTTVVIAPFLGGGSFELDLVKRGVVVHAADAFAPLVSFWTALKTDREALITELLGLHPFTKELYRSCQSSMDSAAKFFIVNRCCFSGCMTGGYTPSRAPLSCLEKLRAVDVSTLDVQLCDYETLLTQYPTDFAYLDPPYDVPNLYASAPFDHERLARVLRARTSDWVLCYNDTPRIRALYGDWCDLQPVSWSYGMNTSKTSNEIFIRPRSKTEDSSAGET